MHEKKVQTYLGGSAAVANHLSSFCNKVNFLTYVGKESKNLNFIKKNLMKNFFLNTIFKKDSSTIIKKRFIESVSKSKLLGVYTLNDTGLLNKDEHMPKLKD